MLCYLSSKINDGDTKWQNNYGQNDYTQKNFPSNSS